MRIRAYIEVRHVHFAIAFRSPVLCKQEVRSSILLGSTISPRSDFVGRGFSLSEKRRSALIFLRRGMSVHGAIVVQGARCSVVVGGAPGRTALVTFYYSLARDSAGF